MFQSLQGRNIELRILAFAYHNLQIFKQEELEKRVSGGEEARQASEHFLSDLTCCCELLAERLYSSVLVSTLWGRGEQEEEERDGGERGQNEVDYSKDVEPKEMREVGSSSMTTATTSAAAPSENEKNILELLVNVFLQLRDFYRRALLATNALSPVNPEERQKARTLHFAKFVQPRPMYFGHYQQLIYNQSNPTSSSAAPSGGRDMESDHSRKLKLLQGAGGNIVAGESRYLSEPSLYPTEFLIALRVIQMIQLQLEMLRSTASNTNNTGNVPRSSSSSSTFLRDIIASLEEITGIKPPCSSAFFAQQESAVSGGAEGESSVDFAGSAARDDFSGSHLQQHVVQQHLEDSVANAQSWRTGLVPVTTFRLNQVPLRGSILSCYPRKSVLHTLVGIIDVLREYCSLPLWTSSTGGSGVTSVLGDSSSAPSPSTGASTRRSLLLAVLFSHLCFFQPKVVSLEDTATGLLHRMGVDLPTLELLRDELASPPGQATTFYPEDGDLELQQEDESSSFSTQELEHDQSRRSCPKRFFVAQEPSLLDERTLEVVTFAEDHSKRGEGRPRKELAFLRLGESWMLWANSCNRTLTDPMPIRDYFALS
ncbi:unnamed protein product [Amoebophrya sp. A25]|nr:unnamed protein product [Amoebophrya sp. A25]|eukprot:GSA25T00023735001.1